jgi:cysteine desulfurase
MRQVQCGSKHPYRIFQITLIDFFGHLVEGVKMSQPNKKIIYLDYQSAKPTDPRVIEGMNPYLFEKFGNASSLHEIGDYSTKILEQSRESVAKLVNAKKDEIIFTSGATESNNLALIGYTFRNMKKGNHILISEVEHISVHNLGKYLEKNGFKVTKIPVDQYGRVILEKLKARITPETILISVQHGNNEIGTVQPIHEIGELAAEKKIAFHCDAVASEGQLPIDVKKDNIDLLSLSSNDIYGPKGVGALFKKESVAIQPLMIGGGQENGLRSGTENIPDIVGMKIAAEITMKEMVEESKRLIKFRERFINEIPKLVPKSHLNGHPTERLPNNTHFRFEAIEGESILLSFKEKGIAVSTGSACSSKTL